MLKNTIVRIAGLTSALFVVLVLSSESALAVVLPDPGVLDGNVSTTAPASGFDVLGQPWLLPLVIVVVGIAIAAVVVIATRRHHTVATA